MRKWKTRARGGERGAGGSPLITFFKKSEMFAARQIVVPWTPWYMIINVSELFQREGRIPGFENNDGPESAGQAGRCVCVWGALFFCQEGELWGGGLEKESTAALCGFHFVRDNALNTNLFFPCFTTLWFFCRKEFLLLCFYIKRWQSRFQTMGNWICMQGLLLCEAFFEAERQDLLQPRPVRVLLPTGCI